MAGLKCSYCGESIRYHGTPNGIEHTVFPVKNWEKLVSTVYDANNERMHEEWNVPGPYLYRADTIWEDFEDDYFEVWICPHCGTVAVFDNSGIHVRAVYTPIKDVVEINRYAEKYVVFSDYEWEKTCAALAACWAIYRYAALIGFICVFSSSSSHRKHSLSDVSQ